jgi:uncharacterized damage-inducible protein DinB
MPKSNLSKYSHRGARALVLLHERELRAFLEAWRLAKKAAVKLPATDDPDYLSLESLLLHLLRSARGYMTRICERLKLPDPGIEEPPSVETVEREADKYVSHLLERWRLPLSALTEQRFNELFETQWGSKVSIENMLEHAVVHPMRHTFQLRELMEN